MYFTFERHTHIIHDFPKNIVYNIESIDYTSKLTAVVVEVFLFFCIIIDSRTSCRRYSHHIISHYCIAVLHYHEHHGHHHLQQ